MTSASELFCNRRWRPHRSTMLELSLEPPAPPPGEDLGLRGPCRRRGRCCGRVRRKERGDAPCPRPFAGHLHQRRLLRHLRDHDDEPIAVEHRSQTPPEPGTGSSSRVGFPLCRVKRWTCAANGQLPDIVEQARERLLERLRGLSLGHNRQTSTSEDQELEAEGGNSNTFEGPRRGEQFASSGSPAANPSVGTVERVQNPSTMKEPQGLSWEAFCSLQLEVFEQHGEEDEETVGSSSTADCSICLEQFNEGDELIRLICGHRFHPACLEPWLRSCGHCPNCRARL